MKGEILDFNLSEEQAMIHQYGKSLAKTYDRAYWMENAEIHRFPEEMYAQVANAPYTGECSIAGIAISNIFW